MRLFVPLMLGACASPPAATPRSAALFDVTLVHGSDAERATRAQIESLATRFDLTPWRFTSKLSIDEDSTPHSHPVLTLHTRHSKDDLLLLSTIIHEESHWCFAEHQSDTDAAVAELEPLYPDLPVGFPDGATSHASSYEHLMVIAFEWRGLRHYVGELAAREVMNFWATDHYRAIYKAVLANPQPVWDVLARHGFHVPDSSGRCRT